MSADARIPAVILAPGAYPTSDAKVAHGLVRDGDRFRVVAILDASCAGHDAGELLDGRLRGIPVVAALTEAMRLQPPPEVAVVGVATHGGRMDTALRALLLAAVDAGLGVVNGLHDCVADDAEIAAVARRRGVTLVDLRRPPPVQALHAWHGDALSLRTPRIAILGTDCAVGKRTTTRVLMHALREAGIRAEMIYTGQTGWMQGARFGLILDATPNDFVCGELEHALVTCEREAAPDVMLIEGQSALRNPSGPCGAELLLAGGARGVILQHAPGRIYFEGHEDVEARIPPIDDEIHLIGLYGAEVLAITLHAGDMDIDAVDQHRCMIESTVALPVIQPLRDDPAPLVTAVRRFIEEYSP